MGISGNPGIPKNSHIFSSSHMILSCASGKDFSTIQGARALSLNRMSTRSSVDKSTKVRILNEPRSDDPFERLLKKLKCSHYLEKMDEMILENKGRDMTKKQFKKLFKKCEHRYFQGINEDAMTGMRLVFLDTEGLRNKERRTQGLSRYTDAKENVSPPPPVKKIAKTTSAVSQASKNHPMPKLDSKPEPLIVPLPDVSTAGSDIKSKECIKAPLAVPGEFNPFPEGSVFSANGKVIHFAYINGEDAFQQLSSFCKSFEGCEKKDGWDRSVTELKTHGYACEIDRYSATSISKTTRSGFLGSSPIDKLLVFKQVTKNRVAVATFQDGSTFVRASPSDVRWFFTNLREYHGDGALDFEFNDKASKKKSIASALTNVPMGPIGHIADFATTEERVSPVKDLNISVLYIKRP